MSTAINTSTQATSVADILERVLDKGVVVAGDIRIKLCDIELLTIQLRLVLCSVEKAKEIGLDWGNAPPPKVEEEKTEEAPPRLDASEMASRLAQLEEQLARMKQSAEPQPATATAPVPAKTKKQAAK